jgi:hypothetical protein
VIPEAVTSIADYHDRILQPMYRAIAPHDPDGILADDWLNSRAAIARFDRQTIEIRIIDLQECPAADLAIARAVVALVKHLYEGEIVDPDRQQAFDHNSLADLLFECARHGSAARVEHRSWLDAFGIEGPVSAGLAWRTMFERGWLGADPGGQLETILEHGTLAERIKRRTGNEPNVATLTEAYRELTQCLAVNRTFLS